MYNLIKYFLWVPETFKLLPTIEIVYAFKLLAIEVVGTATHKNQLHSNKK